MRKFIFFVSVLLLPALTWADAVKQSDISFSKITNPDFKLSGYLDGSYNYLVRSNQFTSGTFDRVYDITENGFTLQQVAIALAYQPEQGFGGLVNPIIGRDTYTFSPYGWDPYFGSQWLGFDIPQAYLQYVVEKFTIIGGELFTLASVESVDPTKQANFSHSILWGYATPTTTLGFRGTYVMNEKLTLIAGLDNGWDTIRDFSRRKTIELSVAYMPHPIFSVAVTGYSGGQRAADRTSSGSESIRNLIDIIATLNATDKLAFVANYDYGIQSKALLPSGSIAEAVFQGIAGYVNYKFYDEWRTSLRGEIFSDRNGYRTGVVQCWKELTLTLGYVPIKNLELRAETRHDFSNVGSFVDSNGVGASNSQQSYALEAVYQF
jgi:hypothetical protein